MKHELAVTDRSRVRFPDLDGLRAIAAFAVILYHLFGYLEFPKTLGGDRIRYVATFADHGGALGVTFFFLLSGFLITYLMLIERETTGRVHIGQFYMRRVLRIWPLYFLTLIIGFLVCSPSQDPAKGPSVLLYATFLANFDNIIHGDPACGILGVQWSVAIEEQFYLIWPLLFAFIGRYRSFPHVLIILTVLSELYQLGTFPGPASIFHFFSAMRFLTCGALLALLLHRHAAQVRSVLGGISVRAHMLIHSVGTCSLFLALRHGSESIIHQAALHTGTILFFSYVLSHQTHAPVSFLHLRHVPGLAWLGKISYGLYLVHMIVIHFVLQWFSGRPDLGWFAALLTVALTVLISHLSYRYYESFFLRLKGRFAGDVAYHDSEHHARPSTSP